MVTLFTIMAKCKRCAPEIWTLMKVVHPGGEEQEEVKAVGN